MKSDNQAAPETKQTTVITRLEATSDTMTGRGGLNLLVKYIEAIGISSLVASRFSHFRKNKKGARLVSLFKQILCFFFDGTSHAVSYFDDLKKDGGYAAIIEEHQDNLVSSHQIKRFLGCFSPVCGLSFRWVLKQLFVWRLQIEQPTLLIWMLDTMVMDNDTARKREGVKVTYKKKKGFQPLHLIWNGKIIDALFRGGSTHGNSGDGAKNLLTGMVKLVRKRYSQSIPIIIRMDSGFLDIKILKALDKLGVGFICSGKMYTTVKDYIAASETQWQIYDNGHQRWDYQEFGFRCDKWDCFYRAFYTRLHQQGRQFVLDFARPDNVILTNLGTNDVVSQQLLDAGHDELLKEWHIITNHHLRGGDELPHRGLKEFGSQRLPFQKFAMNTAWYYVMVIAFFLFECFKEDHLEGLVGIGAYPNTVRRLIIDIAAKIVKKSRYITLKVTQAIMDRLNFKLLWNTCQSVPLTVMSVLA